MRKYTKPVMEMEKIEMNQAIAACHVELAGYSNHDNRNVIKATYAEAGDLKPVAWGNRWGITDQDTLNEKLVFPVYDIYIENESFRWEDLNYNGVFEYDGSTPSGTCVQDYTGDNCQNVVVGWDKFKGKPLSEFIS